MRYKGPDRRIHRVFVTRNSEYHLKLNTCVAIRDRKTGEWQQRHLALYRDVSGSIAYSANGNIRVNPGLPKVGESMYFDAHDCELITSAIVSVERPRYTTVVHYKK
jgi:hypothetical protein